MTRSGNIVAGLLLSTLVMGCPEREQLPPVPPLGDAGMRAPFDAGPPLIARDSGGVDAGGGADAGPEDATLGDAAADGGTDVDAGPPPLIIDGVLSEGEWSSRTTAVLNDTPSLSTPFAGSSLVSLRALVQTGRLYLALEGMLTAGHAWVLYIDTDVGGSTGLVGSPTGLGDLSGDLDLALTRAFFTPADLRIDGAWGTLDLNRRALGNDSRMGFRDISPNSTNYGHIDASQAPTSCSAAVCEMSILLSSLDAGVGTEIGVYARLVNAGSEAISNQTLPMDAPSAPEVVSVFLRVPNP